MQQGQFTDIEKADWYLILEEFTKMEIGRELNFKKLLAEIKGIIQPKTFKPKN